MQANVVKMGFGRMALSPEKGDILAEGLLKNLDYEIQKKTSSN